ncbi:hypothetical protein IE53DRAFT_159623 [Violaceomyces palustris]|uniref:Uncharacterized protein n=1 Tax=Violaceomyces palustris TaxID=1673888 RepID=A0ACD0NTS3_9BASI|nr:hypothetical protein IE53DRAFT_159623 [Violaceomyces palustris]
MKNECMFFQRRLPPTSTPRRVYGRPFKIDAAPGGGCDHIEGKCLKIRSDALPFQGALSVNTPPPPLLPPCLSLSPSPFRDRDQQRSRSGYRTTSPPPTPRFPRLVCGNLAFS